MTRRTLLSALSAAIAGKESLKASPSIDLEEMQVDSSKLYVLYLDAEMSQESFAHVQNWWKDLFAPDKPPKLVVCNRNYARLSIAQPLGADDIEAAVTRGVTRAMKTSAPVVERRVSLCRECESEPIVDRWTNRCRNCDPEGAAKYEAEMGTRLAAQERMRAKERDWLAAHPEWKG
jgi:hypothetical protein